MLIGIGLGFIDICDMDFSCPLLGYGGLSKKECAEKENIFQHNVIPESGCAYMEPVSRHTLAVPRADDGA